MSITWRKRVPGEYIGPIAYSLGSAIVANAATEGDSAAVGGPSTRHTVWKGNLPCPVEGAWCIAEDWCRKKHFLGVLVIYSSKDEEDRWVAIVAPPGRWPLFLRRLRYRFLRRTGRERRRPPSLVIRKRDGRILRTPNTRGRREKTGGSARRRWWIQGRQARTTQRGRHRHHTNRSKEVDQEPILFGATSYLDLIASHHPAAVRYSGRR